MNVKPMVEEKGLYQAFQQHKSKSIVAVFILVCVKEGPSRLTVLQRASVQCARTTLNGASRTVMHSLQYKRKSLPGRE